MYSFCCLDRVLRIGELSFANSPHPVDMTGATAAINASMDGGGTAATTGDGGAAVTGVDGKGVATGAGAAGGVLVDAGTGATAGATAGGGEGVDTGAATAAGAAAVDSKT